jgi:hypothetical protein
LGSPLRPPGPFDDITFSFLTHLEADVASGTAYLFTVSKANVDSPEGLAGASPLAISTGVSDGAFDFSSSLMLEPDTTYYLYTSSEQSGVGVASSGGPGGAAFAPLPSFPFFPLSSQTLDFSVQGTAVSSVPEPATLGLSAAGLALLLLFRNRNR